MKTGKAVLKRDRILKAAAKILGEKGYAETKLSEIGQAAGTYAGSLYYYFSSKDDLVEEVLNIGTTNVANRVIEEVEKLPDDTSAYDKIRIALRVHLVQTLLMDDFAVAYWKIIDQVPEGTRQKHLQFPRAYGKFWKAMFKEAQESEEIKPGMDARLLELLLIGSTIYALDWFNPSGKYSPAEIADVLADMFFFGVLPEESPRRRSAGGGRSYRERTSNVVRLRRGRPNVGRNRFAKD